LEDRTLIMMMDISKKNRVTMKQSLFRKKWGQRCDFPALPRDEKAMASNPTSE
jgi:hypothetical protein